MLDILHQRGAMGVSQMSEATGYPLSEASEYLRILNARGLLRVKRDGLRTYYTIGGDPTVPWTTTLINAVVPALGADREEFARTFKALTALTHHRRHCILFELSRTDLDGPTLRSRTGITKSALMRHLGKLRSRGMVVRRNARYRLARPRDVLRKTLLKLASMPP